MRGEQSIGILGGSQTDFARNWVSGGGDIYSLLSEVVLNASEAADVPLTDVEVVHVGNLAAEVFCGQAQLGGLVASIDPALAELPSSRHEAACASGSIAILAAMADIEAGRYDVALVIGAEIMRNFGGKAAGEVCRMAAWNGVEAVGSEYPWPFMFSQVADLVAERDGLQYEHLARIAEVNLANATKNPNAQARDWSFGPESFTQNDLSNPVIEGRLRKIDCGRITDGAAAVLLASREYTETYLKRRGRSSASVSTIRGWGHHTAPMLLAEKDKRSRGEAYLFPHLRRTITDAFGRAGIASIDAIDLIETHDCTTITEYVAIDHFGLTEPGQAWKAVEAGLIDMDGSTPINPSGGLIGLGHPVGATGVRMLLDAAKQVTDSAGDYQVDGAKTAATLNIGGSFTSTVSFVVGAADSL